MQTYSDTANAGHALANHHHQGETLFLPNSEREVLLAFKTGEQYVFPAPNAAHKRVPPADGNGERSPTICFEDILLDHPHHHRLSCGHDIITKTPEPCGVNCRPALVKSETLELSGRAFNCPDKGCEWHIQQTNKGLIFKTSGYRNAFLSHAYGLDPQEDRKRIEEKRDMATKGLVGKIQVRQAIGTGGKWRMGDMIKRSVSPDLGDTATPQHAQAVPDHVRREQKHIRNFGLDTYKLLKQVHPGKDIQRTESGEIMMEGQIFDAIQTNKAARELNKLFIDGTATFATREKLWATKLLRENFDTLDLPLGESAKEQTASARREGSIAEEPEPETEFDILKAQNARDKLATKMLGKVAQREARKVRRYEHQDITAGSILKVLAKKRNRSVTPASDRSSRAGSGTPDTGSNSETPRPTKKSRKIDGAAPEDNDGMYD